MGRNVLHKVLVASVIVATIASVAYMYWYVGWAKTRSSGRDQERYCVITRVVQAINAYRSETGTYPHDIETVIRLNPELPKFETTGANRLEYLGPEKAQEGVVLRSYGHKDNHKGWNLKYDNVIWEISADGQMRMKPCSDRSGP